MITAKIDVTLIDKARLYVGKEKTLPDGSKRTPKYLSISIVELKKPDKFGNTHMIVESVSKDERLAGKRGTPLGNGKEYLPRGQTSAPAPSPAQHSSAGEPPLEDDVPF